MKSSEATSRPARRTRLTWDEYFIKMLDAVAERATCDRGRSACIVTDDRRIVATGYVGAPSGFPHCDDVGHNLQSGHCTRTVHAEQNAIASAARAGVKLDGATWYTTMTPCRVCAMLIVTSGALRVVSSFLYHDREGLEVLTTSGDGVLTRLDVKVLDVERRLYD